MGRMDMPGRLEIDQQKADALLLLRLLVRAHQDVAMGGIVGERSPDLLAVDDEMIALEHRGGLQAREVRARIGLRIALAPDVLARARARQIVLLLGLRAEPHDERADLNDALVRSARDAVALQLFQIDHHLAGVERHATPLARPVGRDPAPLVELAPPILHLVPARALEDETQVRGILALLRTYGPRAGNRRPPSRCSRSFGLPIRQALSVTRQA
jgi:hypothetical protein